MYVGQPRLKCNDYIMLEVYLPYHHNSRHSVCTMHNWAQVTICASNQRDLQKHAYILLAREMHKVATPKSRSQHPVDGCRCFWPRACNTQQPPCQSTHCTSLVSNRGPFYTHRCLFFDYGLFFWPSSLLVQTKIRHCAACGQ